MISAEAPALFARATELFIQELTLRAELEAEGNKRRTLNKADIATAITKYDQFDFLIDIVPKEETRLPAKREEGGMRMVPEQVNFYFQQQVQQQMQQQVQQQQQATRVATQQPQVVKSEFRGGAQHMPVLTQPPVVAQQPKQQQEQQQEREAEEPPKQQQGGGIQIIQQLVTPSGEIQQIPVQLTAPRPPAPAAAPAAAWPAAPPQAAGGAQACAAHLPATQTSPPEAAGWQPWWPAAAAAPAAASAAGPAAGSRSRPAPAPSSCPPPPSWRAASSPPWARCR